NMLYRLLFTLAIGCCLTSALAQDTIQIACTDRFVSIPNTRQTFLQIAGDCDSIYFLSKPYYLSIQTNLSNYKKFTSIFDEYRKTVKAADADMTHIIDSYEQIIRTKDEAFTTLYTEYGKMNKLLDKSVGQTKKAVNLGETTLKEVKDINAKLQNENTKLNESLQHLKDIAQREKLNAGLTGGIIGGGVALVVGGIIGGILGYNIHH
ncbi:MAG: hypothetical protein K2Q22_17185, partial [Cytophagales bacterium]|nr:hypothetical protein [Cytophagales bacterium]